MNKISKDYTVNCPAHLTGVVDRILRDALLKKLRAEGYSVSGEQLHLLFFIFDEDGISQKKLGELSRKSKIATVKAINLLEKNNLVVRIQDTEDLRNNKVYLTPLGKKIKKPLLKIVDQNTEEAFRGMSSDEIEAYKQTLRKIMKNIKS
jgi:DNA-binding MarR family transcriptional regulator